MIVVHGVTKRYAARKALDNVSLTVPRGEIALLLGANGAGKSTLLRCVLGVIAFEGQIRVDDRDPLTQGPAVRSLIGYMPQSGGLHPDLTVRQTMEFYADIRRAPHTRIAPLVEEAGLAPHLSTRVAELSGGMRQRLGFAVALVGDPDVLVLDEPTASLDSASHRWLADRLRALAAAGRTVLVSTHASQALLDAADCTFTLEDGVVVDRVARATTASEVEAIATTPTARTIGPKRGTAAPIARKELRDAIRNRWLMAYAATLGVLGLAATATAVDSITGLTLDAFGRTTATLMNLCLLLSPLVAILIGAGAIAGEHDRGTLDHLLAQPVSRRQLLLAKYLGLVIALASATAIGFLPAGVVIVSASPAMVADYLLFPALALCAAAALTGMGVLVSVTCRSAVQAQGAAVVIWFAFALLYDLLLVGSLAMSGLPAEWLAAALVANPIDAARVLGILALEPDLYLLGPAGAFLTTRLSPAGTALVLCGALAFWTTAPLGAAVAAFSFPLRRKSNEENRMFCARRLGRTRGDDRVQIRRRVAGV